jgi:hypothetical protein
MSWKTILINGIVTGGVTLGTGAALFWIQNKEPKLTYNYVKSISFEDNNDRVFIQQFEVLNSGDKAAEDVYLSVTFPHSVIEKSIVDVDGSIKNNQKVDESSIVVTAENLNPTERFSVSALVKGKTGQSEEPLVSLRAKGIKGEKVGKNNTENAPTMLIALVAAYAGVLAFLMSNKKSRLVMFGIVSRLTGRSNKNYGNQQENLASLLAFHGFADRAKEYSNHFGSPKYWVESDILTAETIGADVEVKRRMISVLEGLLGAVNMAPLSESIVLYNIARLYKTFNQDLADEYLARSKHISPDFIAARLEKDSVFQADAKKALVGIVLTPE